MESSDSATDTYEKLRIYREYAKFKKSDIWDTLKRHVATTRDIMSVMRLTGYLHLAEEDLRKVGEDIGLNQKDLLSASEIIFPLCEQKLVAIVLKPFFLTHFSVWRLEQIAHGSKFETGVVIAEDLVSDFKKLEYMQYLTEFATFVTEINTGILNMSCHLEPLIANIIRELAAVYVKNELKASDNEIKCTWFQELHSNLRQWCNQITITNSFNYAAGKINRDVIKLLGDEIYRIVVTDFPEKYRTIFTLRYCMAHTNNFGRETITRNLITDVEKNLLLASVDTKVILNAYASCVEALRELDTTCVVMHKVCGVIKEYLKKRTDTVQQIISYITSDKKDELEKDMTNTKRSAMMDEEELRGVNDEFLPENMDQMGWFEWEPHPVDASIGEGSQGRQSVDVFNMLVSVYGSKEMFVKEYRSLLADRLSNTDRKDAHFEKRYLDLLKLRFQYSELQHCEVMLRDIEQSNFVDQKMEELETIPISACVVSSHYWPKIECDKPDIPLPQPIEHAMSVYASTYADLKEKRQLEWMKGVGCVEIELDIDGTSVKKTVPNMYASVLYLLLEKESWTMHEVAERLGLTNTASKRRLEWWAKQGVLTSGAPAGTNNEVWTLTKNASSMCLNAPEPADEDEIAMDGNADMVDSLEQYWGYTLNYIANHAVNGEMKAERLHRVYRMFGSPTSSGPTLDHVNMFLQRKVTLGLLTYSNGAFRVVQKS